MNDEIVKDGNDFYVKREKKMITKEHVRNWLGSEAQYSDAVSVILDIVRGDYPLEMLELDIKDSIEEGK